MSFMSLGAPVLFLTLLGLVAAGVLVFAARYFHVVTDPKIEHIAAALPGLNCGACGYSSCQSAAEAVAGQKAGAAVCLVGGPETVKALEEILQVSAVSAKKKIAFLCCSRTPLEAGRKMVYNGPGDCFSAMALFGGEKRCEGGCIGLGSCVAVCPAGAIRMKNGLPVFDPDICTGCGLCVKKCPKKIIALIHDNQNDIDRKKCNEYCIRTDLSFVVDQEHCIKCGLCAKRCPVEVISWEKGSSAFINRDRCVECLTCIRICPSKVIS